MPIIPGAPMAIPGCMGMPFAIIMPGCIPIGAGTMPVHAPRASDTGLHLQIMTHTKVHLHASTPLLCNICFPLQASHVARKLASMKLGNSKSYWGMAGQGHARPREGRTEDATWIGDVVDA